MTTQTYIGTLTVAECGECGMAFGMTPEFVRKRERDHATFYCPAGHPRYYPAKSDIERVRERAEYAEARFVSERDQRLAAERSQRALKGVVTRTKRRIGKGVCPCCNRHFANVERHMDSQHPEYAEVKP